MKRRILAFLLVFTLAGATVALALLGNPSVDYYLQGVIVEQAQRQLGVLLTVGSMERNLLLTRFTLQDVRLRDLEDRKREISLRRLVVSLDPLAFFRGTLSIRELRLEGLDLQVAREADGRLSVEPLFPFWERASKAEPGSGRPLQVRFGEVVLSDISVRYRDVPAGLSVRLESVRARLFRGRFDPVDRHSVSITARKGQVEWKAFPPGRSLAVEGLQAVLTITPQEIYVARLNVNSRPLALEASGKLPLDPQGVVSGSLDISLTLEEMPWLVGGQGKVSIQGRIDGHPADPSFRGTLKSALVKIDGRALEEISGDLALDLSGGSVSKAGVKYRGERFSAGMNVAFTAGLPFTLDLSTSSYPLENILKEWGGSTIALSGGVAAEVRVQGKLGGPILEGPLSISSNGSVKLYLPQDRFRDIRFEAAAGLSQRSLLVERLSLESDSLAFSGSGRLAADASSFRFEGEEADLTTWSFLPKLAGLAGRASFRGDLSGTLAAPEAAVEVAIADLAYGPYSADSLETHLDVDRSGVSCPLGSVKKGNSVVTVIGHLPWDLSVQEAWLTLEVPRGSIEEGLMAASLDLPVSGEVTARLEMAIGAEAWRGSGVVDLADLSAYGEKAEKLSLDLSFGKGQIRVNRFDMVKGGGRSFGEGKLEGGRFTVRLETVDPAPLAAMNFLKLLKVPMTGETQMIVEGSGKLDGTEIAAAATLSWDQMNFEGRPWRSGKGTFRLRDRNLEVQAELLDGLYSGKATVALEEEFPFSAAIKTTGQITRQDLNDFLGIGIPAEQASGQLVAQASAEGYLSDLKRTEVEGIIVDADITIRGLSFVPRKPLPFIYRPDTGITFTDLNLKSGESLTEGSLRIGPGGIIEGNVKGEVDVSGFGYLRPTVNSFTGRCGVQLKIAGSLSHPDLSGFVDLKKVTCVAHLPFAMEVADLSGRMEVVKDRLRIADVRGSVGKGTLAMEGDLYFSNFNLKQGDLRWKADGVTVAFPEGLTTVNRAQLELRFGEGKGILRGSVLMDEGQYRRQIDIDNLLALIGESRASGAAAADETVTGGEWLALDVQMRTVRPLDVDLKLLRGTASGSLHLQGTAARPVLSGRMDTEAGTILYRGHSFAVSHGFVGFFNPKVIEPSFDFTGRTTVTGYDREGEVRDYVVELLAVGVPSKFRLKLVSEPPLSEVDTISLLTWGAVGEQALQSRGLTTEEAALLLTRELTGFLESGIERITGFDRVVINPSAISSSGQRSARVRVDKRLGERLSLTYSTSILTGEEQEVTLRYRLTDRLSFVGEQRGEAAYGLDLDFTFEIR